MPGSFNNHVESGILNFLLRANTNSFARPATVAIALCRDVPTESQTGSTIPEITNAGSYARLVVTQNNSNWTEVAQVSDSGNITNLTDLTFATATAAWGHVSGFAIVDNSTYGAGNVLMQGSFDSPREILSGDAPVFRASSVNIYLG